MNYAYVTLLSSIDYIPGVIILNRNLQELNCGYPLYVMITDNIYDKVISYLDKENINYLKVPTIEYPPITLEKMNNKRLETIASKINVFGLDQFDKVVYLDADSFFMKNIDELFNFPDGALYDDGDPCRGFCGLFVCRPRCHRLDYYIVLIHNTSSWESDIIEELWFPFKTNKAYRIPHQYFININLPNFNSLYPLEDNLFGLHFCGEYKPWKYNNINDYFKEFYQSCNDQSELRNLLVKWYYEQYVEPLKQQYPELFNGT